MHNYIIQIETYPVAPHQRMSMGDILDNTNFVGEIADYIDTLDGHRSESYAEDLYQDLAHANELTPFLVNMTKLLPDSSYVLTFSKGFKEAWFSLKYKEFCKVMDRLNTIDEQDFANDPDHNTSYYLFQLREMFNERFGVYIWMDDELYTLDEFIRSLDYDRRYYIGAALDYHW